MPFMKSLYYINFKPVFLIEKLFLSTFPENIIYYLLSYMIHTIIYIPNVCVYIYIYTLLTEAYVTLSDCATQKGELQQRMEESNRKIGEKRKQMESLREELRVLGQPFLQESSYHLFSFHVYILQFLLFISFDCICCPFEWCVRSAVRSVSNGGRGSEISVCMC